MKNNSIFEFADNGIIIRYENDSCVEIMEHDTPLKKTFLKQIDLTKDQKTIGLLYGGVIANTLQCFDEETFSKAVGFKVNLELTPIFEKKQLIPKKKTNN